jgi:vanillate O-demethylase monooxygenase subunit
MFLRNTWYVAAFARDLGAELVARTICKEPVVLFRTADGTPAALADRCCHRSLPLSIGRHLGDRVQCGYHGLVFDATGACVSVPGQSAIPPGAAVRAFPVVERDAFIWIWMGDPALADPAAIPDYRWNADPAWSGPDGTFVGGTAEVGCHYMLSIDNLMDLTHEIYIHRSTLAADSITENPIKTTRTERSVTIERWMIDEDPGALWTRALWGDNPPDRRRADRWQIVTYFPPSHTLLDVGVAPAGTGAREGRREGTAEARLAITLTPIDETRSVYYWVFPNNFTRDRAMADWLQSAISGAYGEDSVALEAQQASMLRRPEPWKVDVNADAGQIAARRLHDRLIAAEGGAEAAAAE